ncbi:MAG: helix-turn-helix domain-containing protein [Lentisphaerae bacterium]|nr:helix-turn-helix domain-containing protein [Lentisphaerota bacterium]
MTLLLPPFTECSTSPRTKIGFVVVVDDNLSAVFTIEELAAYLMRVPRAIFYKLVHEGKTPVRKVGSHWRFRKKITDV